MKRALRHLMLGALCAAAVLAAGATAPGGAALDRVSLMLCWLCLLGLAGALLVGPLHALRTGRVLTNHLLRRDLGIWGALAGLAHLGIAFAISMTPAYMQVYVYGTDDWPAPAIRHSLYSWAVIGSLVVAVLFVLLLVLSNNWMLRRIGPVWWKRLQRTSYAAFVLTVAHGLIFQVIEARELALVVALGLLSLAVVVMQLAGWVRVRAGRQTRFT